MSSIYPEVNVQPNQRNRSSSRSNGNKCMTTCKNYNATTQKTENSSNASGKIGEMKHEHEKLQQPVMNLLKILSGDQSVKNLLTAENFDKLPAHCRKTLIKLLPPCDRIGPPGSKFKPSSGALNNEYFTQACLDYKERLLSGHILPNGQLLEKYNTYSYDKLDPWKKRHFEAYFGEKLNEPTTSSDEEKSNSPPTKSAKKAFLPPSVKKLEGANKSQINFNDPKLVDAKLFSYPSSGANPTDKNANHDSKSTTPMIKRPLSGTRKSTRIIPTNGNRPLAISTNQKSDTKVDSQSSGRKFVESAAELPDKISIWGDILSNAASMEVDSDINDKPGTSTAHLLRMRINLKQRTTSFVSADRPISANVVETWIESNSTAEARQDNALSSNKRSKFTTIEQNVKRNTKSHRMQLKSNASPPTISNLTPIGRKRAKSYSSTNQKPTIDKSTNQKPTIDKSTNQKPTIGSSTIQKPTIDSSTNQKPMRDTAPVKLKGTGKIDNASAAAANRPRVRRSKVAAAAKKRRPSSNRRYGVCRRANELSPEIDLQIGFPSRNSPSGPVALGTSAELVQYTGKESELTTPPPQDLFIAPKEEHGPRPDDDDRIRKNLEKFELSSSTVGHRGSCQFLNWTTTSIHRPKSVPQYWKRPSPSERCSNRRFRFQSDSNQSILNSAGLFPLNACDSKSCCTTP